MVLSLTPLHRWTLLCGGEALATAAAPYWKALASFHRLLASDSIISHWNNLHTNFSSKFLPRNPHFLRQLGSDKEKLGATVGDIFKIQIWIIFGFPASLSPKFYGQLAHNGSLTGSISNFRLRSVRERERRKEEKYIIRTYFWERTSFFIRDLIKYYGDFWKPFINVIQYSILCIHFDLWLLAGKEKYKYNSLTCWSLHPLLIECGRLVDQITNFQHLAVTNIFLCFPWVAEVLFFYESLAWKQ